MSPEKVIDHGKLMVAPTSHRGGIDVEYIRRYFRRIPGFTHVTPAQEILPISVDALPTLTVEDVERNILTTKNRNVVEQYLLANNYYSQAVFSYIDVMRMCKDLPYSNAMYLHELQEYHLMRTKGVDLIANPRKPDSPLSIYDEHFAATLVHCRYLQLKAQQSGVDISLGAAVEYDPHGMNSDKQMIDTGETPAAIREQQEVAIAFFRSILDPEDSLFLNDPSERASEYLAMK